MTFLWRSRTGIVVSGKVMSREVTEFIRRFLRHILPPNFVRIRYFRVGRKTWILST
ncbi:MAG: hypothetical protein D6675_09480 [Gemmatimonadetes bacterium]|nr:MAG: hypothetical protein D6675_09480 [Gemmatimonadota bacterium]